jgi:hypothetical protein
MKLAVVPIPRTQPEGSLYNSHNLPALFDFARMAEDAGVDDLAMSEHVVMAHRRVPCALGRDTCLVRLALDLI